jgi:glutathione S-transferase
VKAPPRLYYSPGACSLAPHIALAEIGKPYELELVDAKGGRKTDTPEWRAVNPKGRVPALTGVAGSIGGAAGLLTEAHAILFYLARTHPESGLWPSRPEDEARAVEWMNWLSATVHGMCYGQIWRPQRYVEDPALFPAVRAKGMSNLRREYAYIESLLADGREWAIASGYSVVDIYLLVFWLWGRSVGLAMEADFPHWTALSRQVSARPAARLVFEAEGVEPI